MAGRFGSRGDFDAVALATVHDRRDILPWPHLVGTDIDHQIWVSLSILDQISLDLWQRHRLLVVIESALGADFNRANITPVPRAVRSTALGQIQIDALFQQRRGNDKND